MLGLLGHSEWIYKYVHEIKSDVQRYIKKMTHQGTPASLCWATENPNMQSSHESRGPFWITRFLVSMLKASLVLIRTRRSRGRLRSLSMMKRRMSLRVSLTH